MQRNQGLGAGAPAQSSLGFRQQPDRALGEFKTPSLVNSRDNVVFFHDGRFADLLSVVQYLNSTLNLHLTSDDELAVIEYLKTR